MTSASTEHLLQELERERRLRADAERTVDEQRAALAANRDAIQILEGAAAAVTRELDALRQRVDDQVQDRTAKLVERKDAADETARVKAALLATMTHELRTPLSGIHGMASLLLDSELSEAQRDHACHILSSTEALLSIVDDVLDYSRAESGRLQVEDADFDPVTLVDDVLTLLGSRAADKRIELASIVDPAVPATVSGDPGRVRQILINLVGNALKFTEAGHVLVRMAFEPAAAGGVPRMRYEIEDTGIGIAPEAIPLLFQPFTQASASMSRLFGGTGLGLSICRRFAEALGGSIGVTSGPGAGATFWFTTTATRHDGRFLSTTDQLAGLHVLVMTRSDITRQVVTPLLQSAGAQVELARTSGEVVRRGRAGGPPFHAAIVDLQQREARATVGGVEFHGLLGDGCRVLALAQPWNRPTDQSAREFDAVVMAPIRQASLLGTVGRLLDRARPAPERPAPERVDVDLVGLKILLVDDALVNRNVASTFLSKFGCEWVTAGNGQEALDALAREPFDLVLMDCQMPVMDGFEAARTIRAQPRYEGLPIIAMTAHVDPRAHAHCVEAGMNDCLVKPVRPRVLAEMLLRWTAGAPAV